MIIPSYAWLRFIVDGQLYLQQYVVEDGNYDNARTELYRISEEGEAKKVAETGRGDFRLLVKVPVAD